MPNYHSIKQKACRWAKNKLGDEAYDYHKVCGLLDILEANTTLDPYGQAATIRTLTLILYPIGDEKVAAIEWDKFDAKQLCDLTQRIINEGTQDLVAKLGLNELHRRYQQLDIFTAVKELYTEITRLNAGWGYGAGGICSPTGTKAIMTATAGHDLRDSYPLREEKSALVTAVEHNMHFIGGIMYKTVVARLKEDCDRHEEVEKCYQDIKRKLKYEDEKEEVKDPTTAAAAASRP